MTTTSSRSLDNTGFTFCPKCAQQSLTPYHAHGMRCLQCSFVYFHNAAAAVAALLVHNGEIILTKRSKDPGLGKLDLPGGFVDHGETLENALRREVQEELNLTVESLRYCCSFANTYEYAGVVYHTCDAFFTGSVTSLDGMRGDHEIDSVVLMPPHAIDPDLLAFDSGRKALAWFIDHLAKSRG